MSIFNYATLTLFKQARFGSNIITFDDLVKERNFNYGNKEYHVWIARKEKKDYLLLNDDIKNLPIRIQNTELVKEGNAIYHFVSECNKIGFAPKKYYNFRELIDKFCEIEHSNKQHQKLKWIIALGTLLTRLNARICSNTELGKDSTFIILNHLTNKVAVFDKPKTLAKLEYGLINDVLMVNELIPHTEEERHNINDFLLSVGSLNPSYPKKTRSSVGTKETYDMSKFSLVICYNTLQEVAEKDKQNYFDYSFGLNVLRRFMPFKFSGRIDIKQFKNPLIYNDDVDFELLKIARTIEWYRQNYAQEIKQYDIKIPQLTERYELVFSRIAEMMSLYADNETELSNMVSELLNCYYAYNRMLNNNQLISDYKEQEIKVKQQEDFKLLEPEIIDLSGNHKIEPLDFIRENGRNGEMEVEIFVREYGDEMLDKMLRSSDIFKPRANLIKILE